MRRRLFTLAAAGSAVLCVGVCGLWVRSYGRSDGAGWYGPPYPGAATRQAWELSTGRGGFAFSVQTHWAGQVEPFPTSPTGFGAGSDDDTRYAGAGLGAKPTLGFAVIRFEPIRTRGFVLPAAQIAKHLGLSEANVHQISSRALRRLHDQLPRSELTGNA